MAVSLTFQPLEAKRIASENDGVGTNLVRRLDQKTVTCCNEKLCGRTISLIDSFSWLLSFVSGKQAENLSVGKTKSYSTINICGRGMLFMPLNS
jgi:hypothetical protein